MAGNVCVWPRQIMIWSWIRTLRNVWCRITNGSAKLISRRSLNLASINSSTKQLKGQLVIRMNSLWPVLDEVFITRYLYAIFCVYLIHVCEQKPMNNDHISGVFLLFFHKIRVIHASKIPVWIALWSLNPHILEKVDVHWSHLNGFSPFSSWRLSFIYVIK